MLSDTSLSSFFVGFSLPGDEKLLFQKSHLKLKISKKKKTNMEETLKDSPFQSPP